MRPTWHFTFRTSASSVYGYPLDYQADQYGEWYNNNSVDIDEDHTKYTLTLEILAKNGPKMAHSLL